MMIPLLFGLVTLVFFLMHLLPGDAVTVMLTSYGASGEEQVILRHNLGLDRPLMVQYLDYVSHAARGDLGRSLFSHQKVTHQILTQLPATLALAAASLMISVTIGLSMGIIAAVRHNSIVDRLTMLLSL